MTCIQLITHLRMAMKIGSVLGSTADEAFVASSTKSTMGHLYAWFDLGIFLSNFNHIFTP